ncbi:hypothetical protein ACA910_004405 [Epithemia clementina (nom. ined.)]
MVVRSDEDIIDILTESNAQLSEDNKCLANRVEQTFSEMELVCKQVATLEKEESALCTLVNDCQHTKEAQSSTIFKYEKTIDDLKQGLTKISSTEEEISYLNNLLNSKVSLKEKDARIHDLSLHVGSMKEELNQCRLVIEQKTKRITLLQKEHALLQQAVCYYKEQSSNRDQESKAMRINSGACDQFLQYTMHQSHVKYCKPETVTRSVVSKLWEANGVDDSLKNCLCNEIIDKGTTWYRKNVFLPDHLLHLLDMNGGKINIQAIDLIRTLETNGEKQDSAREVGNS